MGRSNPYRQAADIAAEIPAAPKPSAWSRLRPSQRRWILRLTVLLGASTAAGLCHDGWAKTSWQGVFAAVGLAMALLAAAAVVSALSELDRHD